MSCRPAELFHLDGGTLREGSSANITILDLGKDWVVDSSKVLYPRQGHAF